MDGGGTTEQALKLGLAAGVAEVLFEKVSVDRLLTPKDVDGWKDVIMEYVVKQGGVELSEEMCTEAANIFAEVVVLGGNSDYAKAVDRYREAGNSESQAKQMAFMDMLGRVGWSGAAGLLSGLAMGGGKAVVDYVRQSGAQSLSNAGKRLIETIQSVSTDAQKTASARAAGINPGDRKTVREIVGAMPSADYNVPYVSIPAEVLAGEDGGQISISKIPSAIRRYMIKLFRGKVLNIGTDNKVYISKDGIEEFSFPVRRMDEGTKLAKMAAGAHLDDTLGPAVFLLNTADDGRHPKATGGWDNFYVMFETDTGLYSGIVKTMNTDRGREFYDITEIQKEGDPTTRGDNGLTPPPARTGTPSKIIIPETDQNVNPGESSPASLSHIPELLQKIKSKAKEGLEKPYGVSEETWAKLQSLADPGGTKELDILADLLDIPPEQRSSVEIALAKALADMEAVAHWGSMTPEVRQVFQSQLEEKSADLQWVINRLVQLEELDGDFGLQKIEDGDTIVNMIKTYKREGQADGEGRQEGREKEGGRFADPHGGSGANGSVAEVSIERGPYTYTYRKVEGIQGSPIQRLAERFRAWGIEVAIVDDGCVSIIKDGIAELREIAEAAAVNGSMVFINQHMAVEPENVLGHEAYHIWKGTAARNAYTDIVRDSIDFGSKAFQDYQKKIADAYLEDGIDLTDLVQVRKFEEELFAYISGQINDGGYEDILRPMFRDFETVKVAWMRFLEEMLGGRREDRGRQEDGVIVSPDESMN